MSTAVFAARKRRVELAGSAATMPNRGSDARCAHCSRLLLAGLGAAIATKTRAARMALALSCNDTRRVARLLCFEIARTTTRSTRLLATNAKAALSDASFAAVGAFDNFFQVALLEATRLSFHRANAAARSARLKNALLSAPTDLTRLAQHVSFSILAHKLLELNLGAFLARQILLATASLNCLVVSLGAATDRDAQTTNTTHFQPNSTNNLSSGRTRILLIRQRHTVCKRSSSLCRNTQRQD